MALIPHPLQGWQEGGACLPANQCSVADLGPPKCHTLLDVPSWDRRTKLFHQGQTSPGGPVPQGPFEMRRSCPEGKGGWGRSSILSQIVLGVAESLRRAWDWGVQGERIGLCLSEL